MSKRILWIPAQQDQPIKIESVTLSIVPTLEAMQEYVEGYIEVVSVLFNNGSQQMIVNEEGLLKEMPVNIRATSVYHAASIVEKGRIPPSFIHGPAILLDNLRLD